MKKGNRLWRCTLFVCLGISFMMAATPRVLANDGIYTEKGLQGTLSVEDIAILESKEAEAKSLLYISSGEEASPGMIILATIGVLALLGALIAAAAQAEENKKDNYWD